MSISQWFLILLGPYLLVGGIATLALGPKAVWSALVRPVLDPPRRPITRPRPARTAVAW
jgi:hypothetical protein